MQSKFDYYRRKRSNPSERKGLFMNETAQVALNEITQSENNVELGVKLVEILKRAVVSNLARPRCKQLQFASQLNDVHCYTDPFMAGDHPETMLAFLERNLLSMEDDEEPSKAESLSEKTGVKSEIFSIDDASLSEMPDDRTKTVDLISQRLLREEDAWQAIKPCSDFPRKCCELLRLLSQDPLVADLKVSLYITACNNVRIKPFPDHVVDETPDGLLGLTLVNNLIPPVEVLKLLLEKRKMCQLNENVVNVVHWLMVQLRQPKLVILPRENFDSVFDRVQYAINLQCPTYIAKIMVNNLSSNYLQWQAAKGQLPTKYAFYGARVEHIHSLVHLGLYPFQKVAGPMGKGIYLTTDLKYCLESSPPSWVWGKSTIGTQLQTIAVVEFIDRSSKVVSYRDKSLVQQPGQGRPFNYYIPNTNLIQARYLLIFVKDSHRVQTAPAHSGSNFHKILIGGAFVGSYLTLCYVAWKSIRSTNVTFWDLMIDKFKNIRFLAQLPDFIRSSTE